MVDRESVKSKMEKFGITDLKVDEEIDFPKALWLHLDRLGKAIMENKFNSFMNGVLYMESMLEGYLDEEYETEKKAIEGMSKGYASSASLLMQQALLIHKCLMRCIGRAGFLPEWKGTVTESWRDWSKEGTKEIKNVEDIDEV